VKPLLLLLTAAALQAQTLNFEVASIKSALPPDPHQVRVLSKGGPGTGDPGRWSCENLSLQELIVMAYDVLPFQVSGPSWLGSERFQIAAKVPAGASKADLRVMLQNLLKDRFRLQLRREQKESAAFDLVVAKGGPKLTPSPQRDPDKAPKFDGRFTMGKDGMPEVPPGVPFQMSMRGRMKRQAVSESMEAFAAVLAKRLERPVADRTGLKGEYDFTIVWADPSAVSTHGDPGGAAAVDPETSPTLLPALQEQLGLKLEPKRGTLEILVLERIEKVPTDN